MEFDQPAGITWEQTLGSIQIAIDAVSAGHVKRQTILREWDTDEGREGFQVIVEGELPTSQAEDIMEMIREMDRDSESDG